MLIILQSSKLYACICKSNPKTRPIKLIKLALLMASLLTYLWSAVEILKLDTSDWSWFLAASSGWYSLQSIMYFFLAGITYLSTRKLESHSKLFFYKIFSVFFWGSFLQAIFIIYVLCLSAPPLEIFLVIPIGANSCLTIYSSCYGLFVAFKLLLNSIVYLFILKN